LSRTRTLLVGGNDAFLDGIVDWVANEAQFEVVGRAHSGSVALDEIEALGAELVLMDVSLPDMSGFEVTRLIKVRADAPLVVLLSFYDNRATRLEAWAAGADGFVPLSETTSVLTPLVGDLLRQRAIHVGEQGSVIPFKRVPPTDLSK
jgi:DNA-binding NarL/FixJ family response regulator